MTIAGEWTDAEVKALRAVLDADQHEPSLEQLLESLRKLIPSDRVTVSEIDAEQPEPVPSTRPTAPHAMTARLQADAGTAARITFSRASRNFDARERTLLALLRPHISEIYRNATRSKRRAGHVTPRQRMVLQMVARGLSNDEIAARLALSRGTVRKHLDNIFRQLGVSSRTAAVVRAFPDGVPPFAVPAPVDVPRQRERASA